MNRLTLIPAHNEESTIESLVEKALLYSPVCVVDDGSTDQTGKILSKVKSRHPDKLHIIHHVKNTHISQALRDGMRYAKEKRVDYVVTMDAGNSHDPNALNEFFNYPKCDLLIGSRKKTEGVPFYRKIISRTAACAINYCLSDSLLNIQGPKIRDCTSGFRRYSAKALDVLLTSEVKSVAHEFNMEALYLIYTSGLKVEEIEITYQFSNSSFNRKVLERGMDLALNLFSQKLTRAIR